MFLKSWMNSVVWLVMWVIWSNSARAVIIFSINGRRMIEDTWYEILLSRAASHMIDVIDHWKVNIKFCIFATLTCHLLQERSDLMGGKFSASILIEVKPDKKCAQIHSARNYAWPRFLAPMLQAFEVIWKNVSSTERHFVYFASLFPA